MTSATTVRYGGRRLGEARPDRVQRGVKRSDDEVAEVFAGRRHERTNHRGILGNLVAFHQTSSNLMGPHQTVRLNSVRP